MQVQKINEDSAYIDWAIWRKPTHEVTLTYDKDVRAYYSTLRIAPTPWADFGEPRLLPHAITQKLINLKKGG